MHIYIIVVQMFVVLFKIYCDLCNERSIHFCVSVFYLVSKENIYLNTNELRENNNSTLCQVYNL
jgi:hypothetical protein